MSRVGGAALGRIAVLENPVGTGKQSRPHPVDVHWIAPVDGHGEKLTGETGGFEGEPYRQDEPVTEADMVRQ